jgi:hypothetical protein
MLGISFFEWWEHPLSTLLNRQRCSFSKVQQENGALLSSLSLSHHCRLIVRSCLVCGCLCHSCSCLEFIVFHSPLSLVGIRIVICEDWRMKMMYQYQEVLDVELLCCCFWLSFLMKNEGKHPFSTQQIPFFITKLEKNINDKFLTKMTEVNWKYPIFSSASDTMSWNFSTFPKSLYNYS